jgi:23S rRNA (cytosine1962-C5)-methyltransferase
MSQIVVRPDREKPVLNRHPWIFSGAVEAVRGSPQPGDLVDVVSKEGRFLARGGFNPRSQIQVRILTWLDEPVDDSWWRRMIGRAVRARIQRGALPPAARLIHAENDFLPGLIVDRYGDFLVLQALTLFIDQRKADLARILVEVLAELSIGIAGVYERSDVDVRKKEGLPLQRGLLWGGEPPDLIAVQLGGSTRLVDVRTGHKTGTYLDQIGNQAFLDDFINQRGIDGALLSLFSYTGGFGLGSRCHITQVDASLAALELAEKTYQVNHFPADRVEFIQADVFDLVRDFADEGRCFDVIVCDPPKFAHNAGQVERAARGYKDLNLNCFRLLRSGGYFMTFSCSGAVSADLFQKIVFGALTDSGRDAQIIRTLGAGDDHPAALTFPEGVYLKGLLLRVF